MKSIIYIVPILLLLSCKKDKLKDEKEILVGNWQWSHTYYEGNKCVQCCTVYDTVYSNEAEDLYSIEFFEKGKLNLSKNGMVTDSYRIVFDDFVQYNPEVFIFDIHLNGDNQNVLHGRVSDTSLYSWDFPFKSDDSNCFSNQNYFTKQ